MHSPLRATSNVFSHSHVQASLSFCQWSPGSLSRSPWIPKELHSENPSPAPNTRPSELFDWLHGKQKLNAYECDALIKMMITWKNSTQETPERMCVHRAATCERVNSSLCINWHTHTHTHRLWLNKWDFSSRFGRTEEDLTNWKTSNSSERGGAVKTKWKRERGGETMEGLNQREKSKAVARSFICATWELCRWGQKEAESGNWKVLNGRTIPRMCSF